MAEKEMTVGQKMGALRKHKGLTQEALAELMKVHRGTVASYESRDNANPSPEKVRAVADHFGIALDWFYDGLDSLPVPKVSQQESQFLGKPMIPVSFPYAKLRYAGSVPASSEWGDPLASEDFVEVESKFDHPRRFATRVVGDSCEPALSHGDLAIWHAEKSPGAGLLVLAQQTEDDGFGVTVKVLQYDHESSQGLLVPVNPSASAPKNSNGWTIIGKLVGVERIQGGTTTSFYNREGLRPKDLER